MPTSNWEEWDQLPSDLIPLDQVPLNEVRMEMPERAMAVSAAYRQLNLIVHGAKKLAYQGWVVYYENDDYQVSPRRRHHKRCFYLKQAFPQLLFTTVITGPFSNTDYRDVYLN